MTQSTPPYLYVDYLDLQRDPKATKANGNGRKIVVTEMWKDERHPDSPTWAPGMVLETGLGGFEMAHFDHMAAQDRHRHETALEIYMVEAGEMWVLLGEEAHPIGVNSNDMLFVMPGTIHQVLRSTQFIAKVITIKSLGAADKYVQLEEGGGWFCWEDLSKEQRSTAFKWPVPDEAKVPGEPING